MQKQGFILKEKIYGDFILHPTYLTTVLPDEANDEDASITSVGGLVGWQWFPGDEFAIGLGIGVDYYFFSGSDESFDEYDGFAPALRFDIGYAW